MVSSSTASIMPELSFYSDDWLEISDDFPDDLVIISESDISINDEFDFALELPHDVHAVEVFIALVSSTPDRFTTLPDFPNFQLLQVSDRLLLAAERTPIPRLAQHFLVLSVEATRRYLFACIYSDLHPPTPPLSAALNIAHTLLPYQSTHFAAWSDDFNRVFPSLIRVLARPNLDLLDVVEILNRSHNLLQLILGSAVTPPESPFTV